jgi:VanZ family protein
LSPVVIEAPICTRPKPDWKQWIPALIWIGVICVESTDMMSSEHTGDLLNAFLTRVLGQVDIFVLLLWNHYLRKLGHVVGYAILSWLLFRAWRATLPSPIGQLWALAWVRLAFWMTVVVASLDEFHQSFIPSRTGRWQDVVLDSTAAAGMQLLLFLLLRNKTRQQPATEPSFARPDR